MFGFDLPVWSGWLAALIALLAIDLLILGGGSALAIILAIMAGAGAITAYLGAPWHYQLTAAMLSAFVAWPAVTYRLARVTRKDGRSFDEQWQQEQVFELFSDDSGNIRLKLHADTFPVKSKGSAPLSVGMRVHLVRFEGIQAVVRPL